MMDELERETITWGQVVNAILLAALASVIAVGLVVVLALTAAQQPHALGGRHVDGQGPAEGLHRAR